MNMMTIILDTKSKTPIYRQLYAYIKNEIQINNLIYNQKLPSKRKFSEYLGVSQNTIMTAYTQLMEEGYISSKEKKGFFVCKAENLEKFEFKNDKLNIAIPLKDETIDYNFSINTVEHNSFPFSILRKMYKEVIDEEDKTLLQISEVQGLEELRVSISAYLHDSRGVNCTANQIIISSGIEYLVQLIILLLKKNTVFGLENPGYEKSRYILEANLSNILPIQVDSEGMSLGDENINKANVLFLSPSHQFPTGGIMPINRRIQLINWANNAENRYIIEDDYDSEFKYSGKPIPSLQGLDTNNKVIYIGSFSKSLSPTIRISYMVLPKNLLKEYIEKLSFLVCSVPMIEQKVLHRYISEGYFERHLNKMRKIYRSKYEILVHCINELNRNIEIKGTDAGLNILLKINNGMTEEDLIKSALQNRVKVYGISTYYFDQSNCKKLPNILLGYASMSEYEIKEAIKCLDKAWFHNVS